MYSWSRKIVLGSLGLWTLAGCTQSTNDSSKDKENVNKEIVRDGIIIKDGTTWGTPTVAPSIAQSAKQTSTPTSEKSYEAMLASLDKGYPVDDDDVSVNRFRHLFASLEKKTTNTRQQIADMTVTMQRSARQKFGKELKLIEILEASNKVIPDGHKMDYAEISAIVMVTLAQ